MAIATIIQVILVMLLWAACFPLISTGLEFSPHLTFATLRAILAGLSLTALALTLRRPFPRERRVWIILAIVGVGATSLGFLGMFHAAEFVSPGVATVIANTQPLMAAVLASIVIKERLGVGGKVGLATGFTGIFIIASPQLLSAGQENYVLGIAYILLAALGITVSNVLIRKIAGKVDVLMGMGLQMLIGSVPLMLGAWAVEDPAEVRWSFTFIWTLLGLSLLGTALVYWLWFSILGKVALNRANVFSFLVPIFGLTMGVLFFGERLGWPELSGIALALVGVVLVTRYGTRRSER